MGIKEKVRKNRKDIDYLIEESKYHKEILMDILKCKGHQEMAKRLRTLGLKRCPTCHRKLMEK